MTNAECEEYLKNKKPCWTNVSGRKVQVIITSKEETPGRPETATTVRRNAKTEWKVKRADNDRPLDARHSKALHKTRDFFAD